MADFQIRKGDRLPTLTATLLDAAGPINLTGTTVAFKAKSGATLISGAATITDAVAGKVEYAWGANDTSIVGAYLAKFEVTYPGSKLLSVPNTKDISFDVLTDATV